MMKLRNVEIETGSSQQALTFKHLSEFDDVAAHEIIATLFNGMDPVLAASESAWIAAFVKARGGAA